MITIITGAPGSGKTTISDLLSKKVLKGVHIPSDIFYSFIANNIPPNLPEADSQNHIVISSVIKAAGTFSKNNYDVFVDGIFGPWFLKFIAGELRGSESEINYVILNLPLAKSIERISKRANQPVDQAVISQMHSEFKKNIADYKSHLLEVNNKKINSIAEEILENRDKQKYVIKLNTLL